MTKIFSKFGKISSDVVSDEKKVPRKRMNIMQMLRSQEMRGGNRRVVQDSLETARKKAAGAARLRTEQNRDRALLIRASRYRTFYLDRINRWFATLTLAQQKSVRYKRMLYRRRAEVYRSWPTQITNNTTRSILISNIRSAERRDGRV